MLTAEVGEPKDIRGQMLQALNKYNIKQVDVAREAGIHHSTLSLWLQGKVKGHHIKIEDTLAEWLDSLYSGRPRYTTLNKTVDKQFVLTPPAINVARKQQMDVQAVLIPIHFQFQVEGKMHKEQFTWNIHDPYFSPQQFAHVLVSENSSLLHFEGQIRDTIYKAIRNYKWSKATGPCLKHLQLDIRIDNISLKDKFEWDVNDENASPEDFAYNLVQELNLNSEFMVKIAHQIREQIEYYRKSTRADAVNNKSEGVNSRIEGIRVQGVGSRVQGMRVDESSLLDIKKSTRNLISFNDNQRDQQNQEINQHNFIRRNNQGWEPTIQILDAGQMRKFQKLQERQNRYARRAR